MITPAVRRLRDRLGLPGMAVLELAFDESSRHSPHRSRTTSSTAWSTPRRTTRTRSAAGGRALDDALRARVLDAMSAAGIREREPHWGLIRLAFSSRANLAMIQAQDVLGLGGEARMNMPGRAAGNWHWRLAPGALTPELARRLRRASEQAGRAARRD